jgi:nicotinamide-nucleotide amidase
VALEALAAEVGACCCQSGERLTTAESCTGGWVGQCMTAVAGSSRWFERGFITYSNEAKTELLGVSGDTLGSQGAVSEATAAAMALGALARSHADWAIAITGIAGPDGGTPEKPVGTVCFAWAGAGRCLPPRTISRAIAGPCVRSRSNTRCGTRAAGRPRSA